MLTTLRLDNNIIDRIINLNHLKQLTWLDLSFNNIREIEGLEVSAWYRHARECVTMETFAGHVLPSFLEVPGNLVSQRA
eukprot:3766423-Amphidinium_carterae.1